MRIYVFLKVVQFFLLLALFVPMVVLLIGYENGVMLTINAHNVVQMVSILSGFNVFIWFVDFINSNGFSK